MVETETSEAAIEAEDKNKSFVEAKTEGGQRQDQEFL